MWISISVYVDTILKALNVAIFRVLRRIKRAIKNHKKSYIKKPYENRPYYEYILPTKRWRQIVTGNIKQRPHLLIHKWLITVNGHLFWSCLLLGEAQIIFSDL